MISFFSDYKLGFLWFVIVYKGKLGCKVSL